jgi:hypothetical protein
MAMAGVGPALRYGDAMSPLIASIIVIAAMVLIVGGVRMTVGGRRLQGVLMIIAALVILGNLALLMVPVPAR